MISFSSAIRLTSILNPCRTLLNSPRLTVPLYGQTAGAKTLEERLGLPPKPKKPLTPYFRFMKQMRPIVNVENPKASFTDVVRIISKKWETLDENSKKKLQDEYQKEKVIYVETRAKYDSKITADQKTDLKHLKQEINEAKERKAMKKRVKELGRPTKPASAFFKFIAQERIASPQASNQTYRDWHHKTTEKWSRLSDKEKEPFVKSARIDIDKYKIEVTKWEEKMVKLGHIDVVRHDVLTDPPERKPKKKSQSTE